MSMDLPGVLGQDDLTSRAIRWIIGKVALTIVGSTIFALGHHYGWPQGFLTGAGITGGAALAIAAWYLPTWTMHGSGGWLPVERVATIATWTAVTGSVVALLISRPAVGAPSMALLLITAGRTFPRLFAPLGRFLGAHRQARPGAVGYRGEHFPNTPNPGDNDHGTTSRSPRQQRVATLRHPDQRVAATRPDEPDGPRRPARRQNTELGVESRSRRN